MVVTSKVGALFYVIENDSNIGLRGIWDIDCSPGIVTEWRLDNERI